MTVATNDRRKQHVASAAQTVFDYDFEIYIATDLEVKQTVDATGVTNTLAYITDYAVTGVGVEAGGTIVLVIGAAVDDIITIEGQTALARASDFTTGGDFLAGTVNDAEDRQYHIDQEAKRDAERTLQLASEDTTTTAPFTIPVKADRLDKLAGYDSDGDPTAVSAATLGAVVISGDNPQALGAAAPGTTGAVSDAGHVHPTTGLLTQLADDTTPQLGGDLDPNGKQIGWDKGGDIVSASPLAIDTDGNYFDVTGTTGFSAMTVAANKLFMLQFDGILTLTHGASLNLPGGANITTAAGDEAVCFSTAANTVRVVTYTKADGTALVSPPSGPTLGTPVATTSGTAIQFTDDMAGAVQALMTFSDVSTNGASPTIVQLGASGSPQTTGYKGTWGRIAASVSGSGALSSGVQIDPGTAAARAIGGWVLFTLVDATSFIWSFAACVSDSVSNDTTFVSGSVTLSAAMDRMVLTTAGGTDAFDNGTANTQTQTGA